LGQGDSQIPSEKFKREARLCQNLSRDCFDLIIEPIQRFWKGWLKIYELLGDRKNVPDER